VAAMSRQSGQARAGFVKVKGVACVEETAEPAGSSAARQAVTTPKVVALRRQAASTATQVTATRTRR